jgi:hypothetical protein
MGGRRSRLGVSDEGKRGRGGESEEEEGEG